MLNDPRQKNEYRAYLMISDFELHPNQLTETLGIIPSKTYVKGEDRIVGKKQVKVKNKRNLWILESDLTKDQQIESQLENLFTKIIPLKKKFLEISNKYDLSLNCVAYYYEANPSISLNKNLVKQAGEINAEINFDIYCLSGTTRELKEKEVLSNLVEHLSKVEKISALSSSGQDEARAIAESLKNIEESSYRIHSQLIPDLIWEYKVDDETILNTLKELSKEIHSIQSNSQKSKLLGNIKEMTDHQKRIINQMITQIDSYLSSHGDLSSFIKNLQGLLDSSEIVHKPFIDNWYKYWTPLEIYNAEKIDKKLEVKKDEIVESVKKMRSFLSEYI